MVLEKDPFSVGIGVGESFFSRHGKVNYSSGKLNPLGELVYKVGVRKERQSEGPPVEPKTDSATDRT